jgi:hypothetical protein
MTFDVAWYVIRYYDHYMSKLEKLALAHLQHTMKAMHGRSDVAAQEEAGRKGPHVRFLLSDVPDVTDLVSNGFECFVERTAQRILDAHGSEIFLNYCPKCGALARTPKAQQCRECMYDWHSTPADGPSV